MKKFAASALVVALLTMCTLAVAGPYNPPKQWDDLSWWGTSGATPAPVKDAKVNAYWWWPTQAVSNADDQELWGNRGKVLHNMIPPVVQPPKEEVVTPPPTPKEVPTFNTILFDYGKAFLRPEGQQEAEKVAAYLKANPDAKVTITGFASAEGTDQYNSALGQRRAQAVADYLVQQGVAPDRITVQSQGEASPAVPNDTEANRKLNRRAEFQVTVPGQ